MQLGWHTLSVIQPDHVFGSVELQETKRSAVTPSVQLLLFWQPVQTRRSVKLAFKHVSGHLVTPSHSVHAAGELAKHGTGCELLPLQLPRQPVHVRVRVRLPAPHVTEQLLAFTHDIHDFAVPAEQLKVCDAFPGQPLAVDLLPHHRHVRLSVPSP